MAYRYDTDLEFLGQMLSEDLNDLVYCLSHDKDGENRFMEELTTNDAYKVYCPDHNKYWRLIAEEIQCFGANTLVTIFRGKGVEYKEVLTDVCDKLKVNYNNASSTEIIENNLLMKILTDALEKMKPEEIKDLANEMGINNTKGITAQSMIASFQTIFIAGGFWSYQLTVIIANQVWRILFNRGLSLAANSGLTRAMSILAGPIGWVITGIWTAIDIAGPAYRVTIPAVIQVAVLRQKHLYGNAEMEPM